MGIQSHIGIVWRRSSGNHLGFPVVFNLKNPFDFLERATDIIINIVVWQASTNILYSLGCFVFLAFLILLCAYNVRFFFFSDLGILWKYSILFNFNIFKKKQTIMIFCNWHTSSSNILIIDCDNYFDSTHSMLKQTHACTPLNHHKASLHPFNGNKQHLCYQTTLKLTLHVELLRIFGP